MAGRAVAASQKGHVSCWWSSIAAEGLDLCNSVSKCNKKVSCSLTNHKDQALPSFQLGSSCVGDVDHAVRGILARVNERPLLCSGRANKAN